MTPVIVFKARVMKLSDKREVWTILQDNYPTAKWIDNVFANMLTMLWAFIVLTDENDEVVGFVGTQQSFADNFVYEISLLNISKEHQSKGIGTALFRTALRSLWDHQGDNRCKAVVLTARRELVPFYKGFGFQELIQLGDEVFMGAEMPGDTLGPLEEPVSSLYGEKRGHRVKIIVEKPLHP